MMTSFLQGSYMAKANPFAQIAKRLSSLQVKSSKINEDISTLVQIVEAEMKKQEDASVPAQVAPVKAGPKPVSAKVTPKVAAKDAPKTVSAKVVPAKVEKTLETPKKKGRPAKK
jgi:hypothetical protein